ncbi:hypothetical protein EON65_41965 [archaeon]|nr:MAG: hypothetical protein EON65_41965 [archaeon]
MENLEVSEFFKGFNLIPVQLDATFEGRQSQPRLPPAVIYSKKHLKFQDTDAAENEVVDFLQNLNYLNFRHKVVETEIAEGPNNSLDDNIKHSRKLEEVNRFASIVRKRSVMAPTVALSVISSRLALPPPTSIRWPAAQIRKFEAPISSSLRSVCSAQQEVTPDYTKVLQYVPEVAFASSSSSSSSSSLQWVLDSKPVYKDKNRSTNLRLPSPSIVAVVERCLGSLDDQSVYLHSGTRQPKRMKVDYIRSCASHIQVGAGSEEACAVSREKVFKEALGRHFEAVLDSLLHIVLSAVRQVKNDHNSGMSGLNSSRKRAFEELDVELPIGIEALGWEELYTILKGVADQSSGFIQVNSDCIYRGIQYVSCVLTSCLGFLL